MVVEGLHISGVIGIICIDEYLLNLFESILRQLSVPNVKNPMTYEEAVVWVDSFERRVSLSVIRLLEANGHLLTPSLPDVLSLRL